MSLPLQTANHEPRKPMVSKVHFELPEIRLLCMRMHEWCGITLDESKSYLITNRLASIVKELEASSLSEVIRRAESSQGMALRDRLIDSLTTHETLFFRDQSPFEALTKQIVPNIRSATTSGQPRLRIWSAACSTGQEPYSIAIKLLESVPDIANWSVSILATDVASATVEKAKQGIFQDYEIRRGVTPSLEAKYFTAQGNRRQISDRVRRMVTFQVSNLSSTMQPGGPFDVIFLRNVLIYFQPEDARKILRQVSSRMSGSGRLFVGCSEVLTGVNDFLTSELMGSATCYRKNC